MKKKYDEGMLIEKVNSSWDLSAFALGRQGNVLLCVLIFVYYWSSPYQLFPRPGWVDPAIYAGHMLEIGKIVMTYGLSHMSGRLAYNAMGYGLENMVGSRWGHYLEISIYLCIALISVYEISKNYFSVYVTRVAIAFVAVSPLFVNALSHNYPDGASVSLVLAVVALLLKGHRGSNKPRLGPWILAGATTTIIYFVHPMGVISCACALAAFAFTYLPQISFRLVYLRTLTASYIGGGVIALSVFVAAGKILYSSNTIALVAVAKFISGRRQSLGKAYMYPIEDWLPEASRLWWIAAVALLAVWGWWLSRVPKTPLLRPAYPNFGRQQFLNFSTLYLAIFFGLLVLSDVFGASTFLQHQHYASHILAPVFLVATGFIGVGLRASDSIFAKTAFILAIVGQWSLLEVWTLNGSPPPGDGAVSFGIFFAFLMMVISFKFSVVGPQDNSISSKRSAAVVQMFWLASFLIFSMICQTVNGDTKDAIKSPNSPSFEAEFLAANSLSKAIWSQNNETPTYFWFNREALNEDMDRAQLSEACSYSMRFGLMDYRFNAYDDISARFQWDKAIWNTAFPEIGINKPRPPTSLESVEWPITIAVLSTEPEHLILARTVLDNYGFHVSKMASLGQWALPCTPKPVSVALISLSSWAYGFPN